MYQFYYSKKTEKRAAEYKQKIEDYINIEAVRPQMWEEHCLECSAPLCYETCPHYIARTDGRCMRFFNGYDVSQDKYGCGEQSARIKFRKWANMMTIIFPAMYSTENLNRLTQRNQILGKGLSVIAQSHVSSKVKWPVIRTIEYLRRRKLRSITGINNEPDAFAFHGYSFYTKPFRLMIEIYNHEKSVFKTSLFLQPGENLIILGKDQMNKMCWESGCLVKVYPENDIEAEIDIRWCDFVKGEFTQKEKPAQYIKCVVWDLDNTIWNGTLIETEDENTLTLNKGVLKLIEELDQRGIIQSVASKNEYDNAWPVVERLGLAEYFLYPQINWNAKSSSIRQIAKSLNIGTDTLALIDDSSYEREQVKDACPMVRTYDIADIETLLEREELQVSVTEESKNRRHMYRAEEKRNEMLKDEYQDTIEFIRKCNLRIELFTPTDKSEIERCYELTVRTNQLNMSGKKYDRTTFDTIIQDKTKTSIAFSCEDDFGSYGIVGYAQYYVEKNVLIFSEFAMSCRVAGKYVESSLFKAILQREQVDRGEFAVNITQKNLLLRNTLEGIGFQAVKDTDARIYYSFGCNLLHADLVKINNRG